jgi:co-chaperonin GroES (HSP10)
MTKFQALNYIVILEGVENKNVTDFGFDKSGLVDKNEKYKRAVIKSMGPDCPRDETHTIKEGDTVLYDSYKASPLSLDGEQYFTLFYADLVVAL